MFSHLFHSVRLVVSKSFQSNPQLTNGMTGLITFSAGDILSQRILTPEKSIDYERAAKTGLSEYFIKCIVPMM